MDLNLPALASACYVTGDPFVEDERVVSHLVRRQPDGEIVRCDVNSMVEDRFETPGPVVCRWVQRFKPRVAAENSDRAMKLTAETLFLTLADPANEVISEEDARLVQFLALMLERKRLIKLRGRSADGARDVYEHRGSKARCEVPRGELTPEFFIAVQRQLSVLVGGDDDEAEAPVGERSAPPGGADAPVVRPE